jgi:SAM-dependent methyltransferase
MAETTDAGPTGQDPVARLLDLLDADAPVPETTAGYVDLIGEPPRPPTLARRLMESTAVPLIYTRYWRPALGRVAKGLTGPSMAGELTLALDLLALNPGDVVLDVGSGPGNFTRRFADAVGPTGLAIGLDASTSMLQRAVTEQTPGPSPAYLRADAVRPPLRPGSVDAVCCFAALHMFDEPEVALASFRALLRPGGRLALLTSARRNGPLGVGDATLGRVSGMRMFGRGEVVDLLEELGFVDVTRRVTGLAQFVGGRLPD